MKVVIPRTYTRRKKMFFRTPEVNNWFKTKSFELGVLQMTLSDPSMSYSSVATRSAHTRWPKFRIWLKWVKNAHFFTKHELFIKKNMIFCFQNLNFSEYKWPIANRSWGWNNLSNFIYFQNKVWYLRCSILKNSAIFEIFLSTEWFCLNYCYFLLQKIW